MIAPSVRLENATRRFGRAIALDGVTLDFEPGSVSGLLGRNGAGKTTVMSLIAGHDRPSSGGVLIDDKNPFENGIAASMTSFIRDNQRYPDDVYLPTILRAAPHFHPRWDGATAQRLIGAFQLNPKTAVKKYSRGQLSALGIVLGLASRAPLTILDEPYLGLDATVRAIFYEELGDEVARADRTFVISTHLVDEMESILSNAVLLHQGRVVQHGNPSDLVENHYILSGPDAALEPLLTGRPVLSRRSVGSLTAATIAEASTAAAAESARRAGVTLAPATLQDLVTAYGSVSPTADQGISA